MTWFLNLSPQVQAALITAAVTVLGFFIHGWYISSRVEKFRQSNAKELETIKSVNAEKLAERTAELNQAGAERAKKLELTLQTLAKHKDSHREALGRMWNAVSIAQSAAEGLVKVSSSEVTVRLSGTIKFLQRISVFLEAVETAPSDIFLAKEDVDAVKQIERELIRLLLALDLDSGGRPDYQTELKKRFHAFNQKVSVFGVSGDVVPPDSGV